MHLLRVTGKANKHLSYSDTNRDPKIDHDQYTQKKLESETRKQENVDLRCKLWVAKETIDFPYTRLKMQSNFKRVVQPVESFEMNEKSP